MKVKELIYETPEITEEKLLEIINTNLESLKSIDKNIVDRIEQIHKYSSPINELILKEYDLIQDKQSYLTKSQRDLLTGYVGACLIKMVKKDNGGGEESTGNNRLESIPEAEEVRDNPESE